MSKGKTLREKIIDALVTHGVGRPITVAKLRAIMGLQDGEQRQLERRLRDLRPLGYDLPHDSATDTYTLMSDQPTGPVGDTKAIPKSLRIEVLIAANGKCQLCGKTVVEDDIKLDVDHRIPRKWGGRTDRDNLWALCKPCNIAKQAFFAALDDSVMKQVMHHDNPWQRIGELLKAYNGEIVPRRLLELVGQQEQWHKRLRELRYILGWKISRATDENETGKYRIAYRLVESRPWPVDVPKMIRAYEKKLGQR